MDLGKILKHIKQSLPYLILLTAISYVGYVLAWCINNFMRYLLTLVGFRPKVIKYPKPKEDEDIIGI